MIAEVEFYLRSYHFFATDSVKLTKQCIAAIKSIEKHSRALFKGLYNLEYPGGYFTKLILPIYVPQKLNQPFLRFRTNIYQMQSVAEAVAKRDSFWEFKSQLKTVKRICKMAQDAIPILEPQVERGRPGTYSHLGSTMRGLARVFDTYNHVQSNKRVTKKRRHAFIVEALKAANIRHPKTTSTTWYDLLKPLLPKSSK